MREQGLRTVVRRGTIGRTWWGRQFAEIFETAAEERCVELGRRDARRGRLQDLDIEPGRILASVKAEGNATLTVELRLPELTDEYWLPLVGLAAGRAGLLGELLNDKLPPMFREAVPGAVGELIPELAAWGGTCDCGTGMPCAHHVAVAYLVADRLDLNPFLLTLLRGRSREALLTAIWEARGMPVDWQPAAASPVLPLTAERDFFRYEEVPLDLPNGIGAAADDVIGELGFPPFFPAGDRSVMQTLRRLRDET